MSVEPSTLERSALERKDREELTTIAQALGVKPPSRARKAEIVQLILELTGVESAPAADVTPSGDGGDPPAARARGRTSGGRKKEADVDDGAIPDPYTGGRTEFENVWRMVDAVATAAVARLRSGIDA